MRVRISIKAIALFLAAWVIVVTFAACSQPNLPNYEPIPPSQGRTIRHVRGETVVPQMPERVVMLWSIVDALALGVEPVGAAMMRAPNIADANELALGDRTENIVELGTFNQPSLEKIVELQPDLILGTHLVDSLYPRLAQIAPTVILGTPRETYAWKEYALKGATALGKRDEAQALIQQYEQRIAQFQQAMGDRLDNTVVSVARFSSDRIRDYQQNTLPGAVLTEAGLLRPESQQRNRGLGNISLERLDSLDGDILFFVQDNPKESILAQVQENPLWLQLDVVQRGQVHEVSMDVWYFNPGIVTAHMMLNDLFRTLVPDGEQHVIHQVGELTLP